jgi:hypothetical protein
MAQNYTDLEDRCSIARLHAAGQSVRQIAAAPDRSPSPPIVLTTLPHRAANSARPIGNLRQVAPLVARLTRHAAERRA